MSSCAWERECSDVVGAMADAGKCLIGVQRVEMGGRVAEVAARYAMHGHEAWHW